MKKVISLTLCAALTAALAGCSGGSSAPAATTAAAPAATTAAAAPVPAAENTGLKTQITSTDKVTIRLAHDVAENHPSQAAFVECFKKPLEEASGGNITVEIYPNGQLGTLAENMESMRIGDLEMCSLTDSTVAAAIPEFNLVGLPFLWTSIDAAHDALDGDFGQHLEDLLMQNANIRSFGFMDVGFRNITNSKKAIASPDDLKGLKIRTMTNNLHVEYFTALGAIPTPMAFTELFTALQQGTVDGQENPTALIYNNRIYEVQKFMTISEHVWTSTALCIADKFYQGLPKDYQDAIAEAAANTVAYQREAITEQNASLATNIADSGVEVTYLTDDQKKAFQKVAEDSVYKTAAETYGQDLIDMAAKYNK